MAQLIDCIVGMDNTIDRIVVDKMVDIVVVHMIENQKLAEMLLEMPLAVDN